MTKVIITNQRLRNLTTGRLHTKMDDIYKDLETLTGIKGIMTHSLGKVNDKLKPHLKKQLKDKRFWNGEHDTTHTGITELKTINL